MNTTSKYIFEQQEIELDEYCNSNISSLEIHIQSKDQNSKLLTKIFSLNENGKIQAIERLDENWVAYPPLVFETKNRDSNPELIIKESVSRQKNGQITVCDILNQKTNLSSQRTFEYKNDKVVRITDPGYVKTFIYNDDNQLIQIDQEIKIESLISHSIRKSFLWNTEGLVTEKTIYFVNSKSIAQKVFTETFEYNKKGQIIHSKQIPDDAKSNNEILTKFLYSKNQPRLIETIEVFEKEVLKTKRTYSYNNIGQINHIVAENSRGNYTKTIYVSK